MKKKDQTIGISIMVILLLLALFITPMLKGEVLIPSQVTFNDFLDLVKSREIVRVEIRDNGATGYNAMAVKALESKAESQSVNWRTAPVGIGGEAGLEKASGSQEKPVTSKPAENRTAAPESLTSAESVKPQVGPSAVKAPSQPVQEQASRPAAAASEKPPVAVTPMTAVGAKNRPIQYQVILPESGAGVSLLVPTLQQYNVPFSFAKRENDSFWLTTLTTVFVPIIFLGILLMILRNAQGGGSQALSFGKSRAKMSMDSKVKVTFNDVAGIDEAKAELEEVVDFLKNGERYQKLGAKIPKGVLLVGSPGTGKTLLAKAVAGEAGVPFFSISGSDFVEMFVGVGASRVRDLFEQAKKHAPCIIFMDEIDAVGRQRGAGMGGGHDEREQTLNQLLVEMDGFDPHSGIIVLAATNRPDILDNALLRPGRFDRQVMIDRPDVQGREQILKVHAKGKPLASDVDLKLLAKRTPGFTGADLANLLNEGALLAARQNKEVIHQIDIENSIDKVLAGAEKKNKIMSEKDKELTAYHEVGHALVAVLTPDSDPLRKVTIIPRGMALGLTWTMPEDDKVHMSKKQILARIAVALGGRVAEEVVYQDVTTGASNDLEKVSSMARRIVTVYGMNEKLGPITYGKQNEHMFMGRDFGSERNYGEEVAALIDREVKTLVEDLYDQVRAMLIENRDVMDAIVKVLLEKETLDDVEFKAIMDDVVHARGNGSGQKGQPKLDPVDHEHEIPLVVQPD
ncbi:ATP-dependent zinc metalloprotease FtsH [Vampirovibrio chlorellavorus]|uniref:ATP-dependent zinc metalloprotease FtsH n=1 Tax=Vampirovibrio chlorellavorus TaxID=758823 RepID=UPI0026EFA8B7|nr:ATP-dependent zinc metalloprotease FtsH [Vampirovibrio chlorellavorus]